MSDNLFVKELHSLTRDISSHSPTSFEIAGKVLELSVTSFSIFLKDFRTEVTRWATVFTESAKSLVSSSSGVREVSAFRMESDGRGRPSEAAELAAVRCSMGDVILPINPEVRGCGFSRGIGVMFSYWMR